MNASQDGWMARAALRSAAWAERWFPDAWVFAALGVVVVALSAFAFGATPTAAVSAFGDGFWSLIPFTTALYETVRDPDGLGELRRGWSQEQRNRKSNDNNENNADASDA